MTAHQATAIFMCDRDDEGRIEPDTMDDEGEPLTPKTAFYGQWRREGLRDDQVAVLWRKFLADNPRLRDWLIERGEE